MIITRAMKCVKFVSRLLHRTDAFHEKRFFLSQAFECNEVWNSRLSNPLVAKVESEAMYYELNGIFNRTRKMNAIDFDLFVNAQTNDKFLTEVEELAHKLRQTADTCTTLPTTHHAFVRLFIDSNRMEDFVRILHDRINYGIFPDNYCMIFLLNKLLKREDYRNAARIASLKMFQEDFSDNLVKYLSLYSVLKYLPTNEPWIDPNTVKSEEDAEDEEPIMVKVRVLRNPFFDDHFDLTDSQHICGKTLAMIGSKMPGEIGDSVRIMGLALYNKWDKLIDFLDGKVKSNDKIYAESFKFTKDIIKEKLPDTEKAETISKLLTAFEGGHLIEESMIESIHKLIVEEVGLSEETRIKTQQEVNFLFRFLFTY